MKRIFLVLVFFSIFISSIFATGPFAAMVSIQHVTCVRDGSVEFEINGDPDDYTFYWEHGSTSLMLDNLDPGNYTFVVINYAGCKEVYPVEILVVDSECSLSYEVEETTNCLVNINLVFSIDGIIPSESSLVILWDDGYQGGLQRTFKVENDFSGCVIVEMIGNCCEPNELCIELSGHPCNGIVPAVASTIFRKEKGNRGEVIVNEVGLGGEADIAGQFVELLVLGNGVCGDAFDLSGYILDDNNGFLIHGNNLLTNTNVEKIGINNGYLSFKKGNPIWEEIPNGSIIVVQPSTNAILQDDPTDADGNHVYVVSASDNELFSGHTGQWDEYKKTFEYGLGQPLAPSWDLIEFSGSADGLQVRTQEGVLCHGVSCGKSGYNSEEKFEMWLSDDFSDFAFTGYHWFDPESFSVPTSVSPGQSNSTINGTLIASLTSCDTEKGNDLALEQFVSNTGSNDIVRLYPNPTEDILNVKIKKTLGGHVAMNILNTVGQVIYTESWEYQIQQDVRTIQLPRGSLPSGWYTVRFDFADGTQEYRRLIIVF